MATLRLLKSSKLNRTDREGQNLTTPTAGELRNSSILRFANSIQWRGAVSRIYQSSMMEYGNESADYSKIVSKTANIQADGLNYLGKTRKPAAWGWPPPPFFSAT